MILAVETPSAPIMEVEAVMVLLLLAGLPIPMVKALEAIEVRPLEANASNLLAPDVLMLKSLNVATPADADTDVVPDSVPSPVVRDAVTVAVAPPPDVTGFP